MSCDFGVWYPWRPLSDEEAGAVYGRLCAGEADAVPAHPAVDAFYEELTAIHPELDDVPEDRIDDTDLCPWSCRIDRGAGSLVMASVWSRVDATERTLRALAAKHGLALFNPQSGRLHLPGPPEPARRPFWKLW